MLKKATALLVGLVLLASPVLGLAEDGPLTPYADTVVVSMMMSDDPNVEFTGDQTFDNNVVEQFYRDVLNIDFQAKWLIDSTEYSDQLNLAIASNTLPDMFVATKSQVATLAANGQIEDMTDIYQTYASDNLRDTIEFQNGVAFDPVTIDGHIYGIPLTNDFSDEITLMYIRKDWMDNLGLSAPTTLDELIDMANAFATQDPDGNGVDDTFGIATDSYLNYIAELVGHPLNAYRGIWLKGDDGKLVFFNTLPEYKEMLRVLNGLYSTGAMDPEFAVKDINAVANDIAQGKCGIYPCSFWAIYWMLGMSMDNQPEADWQVYPVIAKDDGSYKPRALDTTYRWLVVRKGYEHPEAAVKACNLWQELWQGEYAKEFWGLQSSDEYKDIDIKYYSPIFIDPPYKNIEKAQQVSAAMESGDTSGLQVDYLAMYDDYQEALADNDTVRIWRNKTDIAAFLTLANVYDMNFQYSYFNGPTTDAMAQASPLADQVTNTQIPLIIMGSAEDVDTAFDQYVSDWYASGGQTLTDEVNAWYEAKINAEK